MKKAITFAGGGSKGSYQLGVWTAFNEAGLEFDIATGTSIGSINAGFYVQHDYDIAKSFWETLTMDNVMVNGINLDGKLVSVAEEMDSVKPFIKSYLNYKGADITPFRESLHKYTCEDKFFESDIDYGFMTVKFPSLTPLEVTKKDISPGMLADWINTSCACFPVFPMASVVGQSYIDGGYYDNLPICTAFRLGADEVYAVDLRDECCHPTYRNHPYVKYVYPSRNLGSFMCFEHDVMMKNAELGYRDAQKFFRKLYGKKYSFSVGDEKVEHYAALSRRFIHVLSRIESYERETVKIFNKEPVNGKCTAYLNGRLYYGTDVFDYFIAALEVCADLLHTDSGEIMDVGEFIELLLSVISAGGFRFSTSVPENVREIERMVIGSNKRHRRNSVATDEEILIILAVLTAICE